MRTLLERHLFTIMLGLSVVLHAGALCVGRDESVIEPPRLLPVQAGRTSISLRSSMAAGPRPESGLMAVAHDLLAALPELPPVSETPLAPEAVKPRNTSPTKVKSPPRSQVELPDFKAKTKVVAPLDLDELPPLPGVTVAEIPKPDSPRTPKPTAKPTPKIAAKAKEAMTGAAGPTLVAATVVSAYVSLPSAGSRGSQGAEADGLPEEGATNPAPPYPLDALAAGVEGRVILRVKIDETGRVADVRVYESSKVESLDQSALTTVRRWQFSPAKRGNVPIPYEFLKPIEFTINRRR